MITMHIDENTFSVARVGILALMLVYLLYVAGKLHWSPTRLVTRRLGLTLALLACLSFPNFGLFHYRTYGYIHSWDAFHYFMGSKYLAELGYDRLYDAALIAGHDHNVFLDITHVRDLITYQPKTVQAIDREQIRGHFSDARWREFCDDLSFFVPRISNWRKLFFDHGYNDPPFRAAILRLLTSRVRASEPALLFLTSLDYVVIAVAFVAVFRVFGFSIGVLSLSFFMLNYLARFNFIGGSIGRWDWIAALVLSVTALRAERPYAAGIFLAYASFARVFPVLFLVPWVIHWFTRLRTKEDRAPSGRAVLGFLYGTAALSILTALFLPQYDLVNAFVGRIGAHAANPFLNHVGLSQVITFSVAEWLSHPDLGLYIPQDAAQAARPSTYILLLTALGSLLMVARPISRRSVVESMQYGAILIFLLTAPANYYYSFLVLFPLTAGTERGIHRIDLIKISLLLVITALAYLFELQSPEMLPLYYKVSIQIGLFLILALLFDLIRSQHPEREADFIKL